MKLYDTVKHILEKYPQTRDSDKKLIWAVLIRKQLVQVNSGDVFALSRVMYMDFIHAPSFESITRARRKVQELHPELQATNSIVRSKRRQKEESKGTFISREYI